MRCSCEHQWCIAVIQTDTAIANILIIIIITGAFRRLQRWIHNRNNPHITQNQCLARKVRRNVEKNMKPSLPTPRIHCVLSYAILFFAIAASLHIARAFKFKLEKKAAPTASFSWQIFIIECNAAENEIAKLKTHICSVGWRRTEIGRNVLCLW